MKMMLIRLFYCLIFLTAPYSWSTSVISDTNQSKIIGGVDNTENYPWMVSIQRGYHFCGGVLIGKDWVLTAAHCLDDKEADDLTLYIGLENLSNLASGEARGAEWFIIHPDYNDRLFYSDLAIIKLDQSSGKTPINILSREATLDLKQNEQLRILGWGVTELGSTSRQLKEVEVSFQADQICDATYSVNGIDHYWDRSFCAGEISGGKDSCQGDSGGPILVRAQNEWALTGLVSWGSGCAEAGYYGVYSEVSAMSDWIDTRRAGVSLFGSGRIGFLGKDRSKAQTFTLQNLSESSQTINQKYISNDYFSIDPNNWLLNGELPGSKECSFVVNADGLWGGEHLAELSLSLTHNAVSADLNAKVLSRIDAQALDTQWEFYSGTSQNTEHSKPWTEVEDLELGSVMKSSNQLSGTRSVLLSYLNGSVDETPLYLKFTAKLDDANFGYLKVFINEKSEKTVTATNWTTYTVELDPGLNHTMFIFYQSGGGAAFLDDLKVCTDRFNESSCSSASGYYNTDDIASLDDPMPQSGVDAVCENIDYEDSEFTYVSRTNTDAIFSNGQISSNNTTSQLLGDESNGAGSFGFMWVFIMLFVFYDKFKSVNRFM
ncbi:serine protease [Oceaniserpentilla sp. 4NH20-0058]|uniref:S1 family peptidase n=1 Tax=Oceaniserpentilla sp. 4NH20-0058 TaxID=3127660 RepID=UPI003342854D